MTDFNDGAHWKVYGEGGFEDKTSMTLDVGDESLVGVIRFNKGFVALNSLTGTVLSNIVELETAVATAEAEVINPTCS